MGIRGTVFGVVAAAAMMAGSASAMTIVTLNRDDITGTDFFADASNLGTVFTFLVADEIEMANNAGLELVSASLQGFFGTSGEASAGNMLSADGEFSAECAATSCTEEFFTGPVNVDKILDGSNAVLVEFFREVGRGPGIPNRIVIDELELVLNFDVAPIPLPATAILLLGAVGALGAVRQLRSHEA
ncbi:MAG: VPLPA-CTERM sorting domain-containing protein [Pseudomonadota bacterium]